ncbi:MAG: hypothetical protein WC556_04080 [Candidatus Methanoperedens sp.]
MQQAVPASYAIEKFFEPLLHKFASFIVNKNKNDAEEEIQDARKLIRTFPQCPLIRSDERRPVIHREFIAMIRDEIDDISDMDIKKWLKNFKTEDLLTP